MLNFYRFVTYNKWSMLEVLTSKHTVEGCILILVILVEDSGQVVTVSGDANG